MGEIYNAPITKTTTILEDNQSAIAYSQNALVRDVTLILSVILLAVLYSL
jgi:hypothetical protein